MEAYERSQPFTEDDQKQAEHIASKMYLLLIYDLINSKKQPLVFINDEEDEMVKAILNENIFEERYSIRFFLEKPLSHSDFLNAYEYIQTGTNKNEKAISREVANCTISYLKVISLLPELRQLFIDNPNYDPRNLVKKEGYSEFLKIDSKVDSEWLGTQTDLCYKILILSWKSIILSHPQSEAIIEVEISECSRLFLKNQTRESLAHLETKLHYLNIFEITDIENLYDVAQKYLQIGLVLFITSIKENDLEYVGLVIAIEMYIDFLKSQNDSEEGELKTRNEQLALIQLDTTYNNVPKIRRFYNALYDSGYLEECENEFLKLFRNDNQTPKIIIWKKSQTSLYFIFYFVLSEFCGLKGKDIEKSFVALMNRNLFKPSAEKQFKHATNYSSKLSKYFASNNKENLSMSIKGAIPSDRKERSNLQELAKKAFQAKTL